MEIEGETVCPKCGHKFATTTEVDLSDYAEQFRDESHD